MISVNETTNKGGNSESRERPGRRGRMIFHSGRHYFLKRTVPIKWFLKDLTALTVLS